MTAQVLLATGLHPAGRHAHSGMSGHHSPPPCGKVAVRQIDPIWVPRQMSSNRLIITHSGGTARSLVVAALAVRYSISPDAAAGFEVTCLVPLKGGVH